MPPPDHTDHPSPCPQPFPTFPDCERLLHCPHAVQTARLCPADPSPHTCPALYGRLKADATAGKSLFRVRGASVVRPVLPAVLHTPSGSLCSEAGAGATLVSGDAHTHTRSQRECEDMAAGSGVSQGSRHRRQRVLWGQHRWPAAGASPGPASSGLCQPLPRGPGRGRGHPARSTRVPRGAHSC